MNLDEPKAKGKRKVIPDDEETYPAFANDADPWEAHLAEIDALLIGLIRFWPARPRCIRAGPISSTILTWMRPIKMLGSMR